MRQHPSRTDRADGPGQFGAAGGDPARTTGTAPPGRTARPMRGALAVVATLVAVLAVVGVGVSVATVSSARSANTPRSVGLGGALSTSYGRLTVTDVENVQPMSHEEMAGMDMGDMGINDFVDADHVGVTTTMTIHNGTDRVVDAADPGEFHLLRTAGGRTSTFSPKRTSLAVAGALPAHSSVDVIVTFVVPAGTAALRLSYRDPAGGSPLTVDLGHAEPAQSHHH